MNGPFETERLKSLLSKTSDTREWAAKEFDTAQKQLLVDRSAFFDRLALFHTGTIAATISFSGVLHQVPASTIHWRSVLFAAWLSLFIAMVAALVRNWQAQDTWFHTTASSLEKSEADLADAYGRAVTSGGPIVDRKTGDAMRPSQIKKGTEDVMKLRQTRSEEHELLATKCNKWRLAMEKLTFAATGCGVILVLAFAMRNFE
jgi:hypothetical protein